MEEGKKKVCLFIRTNRRRHERWKLYIFTQLYTFFSFFFHLQLFSNPQPLSSSVIPFEVVHPQHPSAKTEQRVQKERRKDKRGYEVRRRFARQWLLKFNLPTVSSYTFVSSLFLSLSPFTSIINFPHFQNVFNRKSLNANS